MTTLRKNTSLRKKKEFDQVFEAGQSFYCPILGIKALKNTLDYNRLGIIIGLKVSKKAVVRNKIKRQIRDIIRNEVFIKINGYDIVIIVLPTIIDKNFDDIKKSIVDSYKKLKLK